MADDIKFDTEYKAIFLKAKPVEVKLKKRYGFRPQIQIAITRKAGTGKFPYTHTDQMFEENGLTVWRSDKFNLYVEDIDITNFSFKYMIYDYDGVLLEEGRIDTKGGELN